MLVNFDLYALVGEDFLLQVTTVELDGSGCEVGYIVGIDILVFILPRPLLRHQERLGEVSCLIHVGKVEAGIESITPTAAEDHPAGVGTPIVEALCIVTVDLAERAGCALRQVE